jgi:eukaryotic-like serine/threonine-protein kinase
MRGPGTMVGGYRGYQLVERCAGGGGRGVWRAKDWIGHDVAVKFLRPSLVATPELVKRLRAEALAVDGIHHRGVVTIIDYGIDESAGPYMVMRYVEGESQRSELARVGRLTPGRTMALVARAADAVPAEKYVRAAQVSSPVSDSDDRSCFVPPCPPCSSPVMTTR